MQRSSPIVPKLPSMGESEETANPTSHPDATGRRGRIVHSPAPTSPPTYIRPPTKSTGTRSWSLQETIDGAFFVAGGGLAAWLGWQLVTSDLNFSLTGIAFIVLFWLLIAYIGLPRLQEVLSRIYVPDYFIGRTVTGIGVLGDPINLAADGSEASLHAAMQRAGWTQADEVTLRSSWGIIVSAVFRRSYPAAPVSPLFLFDRQQDFAYELEVDGNASQRHHVRFWRVPDGWVLPGGHRVDWLAGATYDRAVGLSAFTLQVTHKIDPDVDVERDFVVQSVRYAVPEVIERVIDDFSSAFTSRNGGGDIVHSDGDLAILDVTPLAVRAGPPPAAQVSPLSTRLPPPVLLISGILGLGKAILALVAVVVTAVGTSQASDASTLQIIDLTAAAGLAFALWLLTLARHGWARTLLMAICTADAVTHLLRLQQDGAINSLVLASAATSVLVLIAVSSLAARRWVRD